MGGNEKQKLIGGAKAKSAKRAGGVDVLVGNVGEKRYLWTARAFAVITAISLCCNIIMLLVINQIMPLFRIEPFLLTFNEKEEQVYNIQQIAGMEDRKAITEVFVREYLLLRSSFDEDVPEMEARWMPGGPIQEMSTPSIYADFLENTAKRALELIRRDGMIRSVRILSVIELSRGLWQVEYETRDTNPSLSAPVVNLWTASMRIAYRKKIVKHGERLKNPIGFTVTEYALRREKVQ